MCLSKVYLAGRGEQEPLMEEITSVNIEGNTLSFESLFGEKKCIRANIKEIDFMTHKIILENLQEVH